MSADKIPYFEAIHGRRTNYALTNTSPISDARIKELVTKTILDIPSSFNSQTTRIVVVLNKEHQKLWDGIIEVYKTMLPGDKFEHFIGRVNGFRAAYGTLLFYEDTETVRTFQEKFKSYEDKFPGWSEQSNGMHQHVLWTALEVEGLGVNLQHYNPPIDKRIETDFKIPETWSLKAQMVFGTPTAKPGEKTFEPVEGKRMLVFGES